MTWGGGRRGVRSAAAHVVTGETKPFGHRGGGDGRAGEPRMHQTPAAPPGDRSRHGLRKQFLAGSLGNSHDGGVLELPFD